MHYGIVELHSPLDHASLVFSRALGAVSASLYVSQREPNVAQHIKEGVGLRELMDPSYLEGLIRKLDVFSGLSVRFQEDIGRNGFRFYPTTEDLTGFVCDGEESEPFIAITEIRHGRGIGLGCYGSREIGIDDMTDFRRGIQKLEKVTNSLLRCVYEKAGVEVPDLNLWFTPNR